MEIEPVGRSGGPSRPWRTAATIAAPLLVLVVVAGAAIAGTGPAATEDAPAQRDAPPAASTPPPRATATTAPTSVVDATFPRRVLGIPVRTVEETIDLRRSGELGDEVVAVRGYLTVRPGPVGCFRSPLVITRLEAVSCQRETVLLDTPEPVLAWADGDVAWLGPRATPHVHPQALPGTSLVDLEALSILPPPTVSGADGRGNRPIAPVPVVVLGRFDDPRLVEQAGRWRHPADGFALERVAWAEGDWQDRPTTRFLPQRPQDPDIDKVRQAAGDVVEGRSTTLGHVVLDLDRLGFIDPAAATATRRALASEPTDPDFDRLWYVRYVTRDDDPRVGWVVLRADATPIVWDADED